MFRGRTVFSGPQDDGTHYRGPGLTCMAPRLFMCHHHYLRHVLHNRCQQHNEWSFWLTLSQGPSGYGGRPHARSVLPQDLRLCLDSGMCSKGHQGSKTAFNEHCRSIPFISGSTLTAFREALTGNNIYLMKYHTASPKNHPFYLLTF